jgi:hypothetical protein
MKSDTPSVSNIPATDTPESDTPASNIPVSDAPLFVSASDIPASGKSFSPQKSSDPEKLPLSRKEMVSGGENFRGIEGVGYERASAAE